MKEHIPSGMYIYILKAVIFQDNKKLMTAEIKETYENIFRLYSLFF